MKSVIIDHLSIQEYELGHPSRRWQITFTCDCRGSEEERTEYGYCEAEILDKWAIGREIY